VIRQMTVGATLRAMGADDGIVHQAATDGLLLTAEPVSAAAASAKEEVDEGFRSKRRPF